MKPIRNETSLVLAVAVLFSAIAIPALSGFLEPSQPPAVAAVQVGNPRDDDGDAAGDDGAPAVPREPKPQPEPQAERGASPSNNDAQRRRAAPQRSAPAPPAQPAPSAPADDAADDDLGEAD
jgi:hypothetical protein